MAYRSLRARAGSLREIWPLRRQPAFVQLQMPLNRCSIVPSRPRYRACRSRCAEAAASDVRAPNRACRVAPARRIAWRVAATRRGEPDFKAAGRRGNSGRREQRGRRAGDRRSEELRMGPARWPAHAGAANRGIGARAEFKTTSKADRVDTRRTLAVHLRLVESNRLRRKPASVGAIAGPDLSIRGCGGNLKGVPASRRFGVSWRVGPLLRRPEAPKVDDPKIDADRAWMSAWQPSPRRTAEKIPLHTPSGAGATAGVCAHPAQGRGRCFVCTQETSLDCSAMWSRRRARGARSAGPAAVPDYNPQSGPRLDRWCGVERPRGGATITPPAVVRQPHADETVRGKLEIYPNGEGSRRPPSNDSPMEYIHRGSAVHGQACRVPASDLGEMGAAISAELAVSRSTRNPAGLANLRDQTWERTASNRRAREGALTLRPDKRAAHAGSFDWAQRDTARPAPGYTTGGVVPGRDAGRSVPHAIWSPRGHVRTPASVPILP